MSPVAVLGVAEEGGKGCIGTLFNVCIMFAGISKFFDVFVCHDDVISKTAQFPPSGFMSMCRKYAENLQQSTQ